MTGGRFSRWLNQGAWAKGGEPMWFYLWTEDEHGNPDITMKIPRDNSVTVGKALKLAARKHLLAPSDFECSPHKPWWWK